MRLLSYFQIFSRSSTNSIKLGRWRHTGTPCHIKIENCSDLRWHDNSHDSNTSQVKRKLSDLKKEKEDEEPYFKKMSSDEAMMYASIYC